MDTGTSLPLVVFDESLPPSSRCILTHTGDQGRRPAACRRILQRYPEVKVIALSVHNDGPVPQQLLKLGAKGFLSKDSGVDEMVLAIQNVMHGKHYICPKVASNLALSAIPGNEQSPFERLSQREMEVVNLTLEGKTIREISTMLAIGEKTVNTYRYRVYEKLKVKNDVEMTRLAIKYRYIEP